jgi:hypothetical protein
VDGTGNGGGDGCGDGCRSGCIDASIFAPLPPTLSFIGLCRCTGDNGIDISGPIARRLIRLFNIRFKISQNASRDDPYKQFDKLNVFVYILLYVSLKFPRTNFKKQSHLVFHLTIDYYCEL